MKIKADSNEKALFALCWIIYFVTYIGRLNYVACMAEIIVAENFTKSQGGLIGMGFFITYGIGQLINGFVGDKVKPRPMIFTGLLGSALCNLAMGFSFSLPSMIVIWSVNGFIQSLIWSPILRLFAQNYSPALRGSLSVYINSTVPAGTLFAFLLTSLCLFLTGDWKTIFFLAAALLCLAAVVWWFCIRKLLLSLGRTDPEGNGLDISEKEQALKAQEAVGKGAVRKLFFALGIPLICLVLVIQGMLKDGLTAWIPTYMLETFDLTALISIVSTTAIPAMNLCGIFLAAWARKRTGDEVKSSIYFFLVTFTALFLLRIFAGDSMALTLFLFGIVTTMMMAVNTMLISVLPGYFRSMRRTSTVSGLLNSSTYVGCALSVYGFAGLSEQVGWNSTIVVWMLCALMGGAVASLAWFRWRNTI